MFKKKIAQQDQPKRPVGVHRELYNLYVHQGKDNNKGFPLQLYNRITHFLKKKLNHWFRRRPRRDSHLGGKR